MSKKDIEQNIYVVQNEETKRIKIGITRDINIRMTNFTTDSGCEINLLYLTAKMPNARIKEALIHEELKEYRHIGEWFNIPPEIAIQCIESIVNLKYLNNTYKSESDNYKRTSIVNIGKLHNLGGRVYINERTGAVYQIAFNNGLWSIDTLTDITDK